MHVASTSVETRDRMIVLIEHPGARVCHQPAESPQITGPERDRVIGGGFDRSETRVGLDRRITLPTVIDRLSLAEVRILAAACKLVIPADGFFETDRIDTQLAGELRNRVRASQMT